MTDKALLLVVLAVMLGIAFLLFAEIHGKYRDAIANRLHDDCIMCSIYRYSHSGSAAFAIREANRTK